MFEYCIRFISEPVLMNENSRIDRCIYNMISGLGIDHYGVKMVFPEISKHSTYHCVLDHSVTMSLTKVIYIIKNVHLLTFTITVN